MESLLKCSKTRDSLLTDFPMLIGGEMEGFGYIPSLKDTHWLIIKSVSDFGDENFTKEKQVITASKSANVFPDILLSLVEHNLINLKGFLTEDGAYLRNILIGQTVEITDDKFNSDSINDYLNDYIYPIIEQKLIMYRTCNIYNNDFIDMFSGLILEVIQNSFRHAGATKVKIHFNTDSIIIEDDKKGYDLNKLTGPDGGTESWNELKEEFINTEYITYEFHKNKHKFKMPYFDINVAEIIKNCHVSILPAYDGEIGHQRESQFGHLEK